MQPRSGFQSSILSSIHAPRAALRCCFPPGFLAGFQPLSCCPLGHQMLFLLLAFARGSAGVPCGFRLRFPCRARTAFRWACFLALFRACFRRPSYARIAFLVRRSCFYPVFFPAFRPASFLRSFRLPVGVLVEGFFGGSSIGLPKFVLKKMSLLLEPQCSFLL